MVGHRGRARPAPCSASARTASASNRPSRSSCAICSSHLRSSYSVNQAGADLGHLLRRKLGDGGSDCLNGVHGSAYMSLSHIAIVTTYALQFATAINLPSGIGHVADGVRASFRYAAIFAVTSGCSAATSCASPSSVLRSYSWSGPPCFNRSALQSPMRAPLVAGRGSWNSQ